MYPLRKILVSESVDSPRSRQCQGGLGMLWPKQYSGSILRRSNFIDRPEARPPLSSCAGHYARPGCEICLGGVKIAYSIPCSRSSVQLVRHPIGWIKYMPYSVYVQMRTNRDF